MNEPKINYAPEPCGFCGGSDTLAQKPHECYVCGGSGSILVAQPARQCASCKGSGKNTHYTDNRCPICDGTGWAYALKTERKQSDIEMLEDLDFPELPL